MAATGPYIIYKSSQFCAAVRSNVDFDHPLRKRIQEVTFSFPNGVNTMPPRLNLKSLTTAVNVICQQVRERREKFLMKRQNVKQARRGFREDFHSQTKESNMSCENSIASDSNIRLLGAAGFLWEKERITDYEFYRYDESFNVFLNNSINIISHVAVVCGFTPQSTSLLAAQFKSVSHFFRHFSLY